MNFKFGVQRVRLNLCKNGLGAAHRARVCRLEYRRLGFERRILKNAYTFPSPDACAVRGHSISKYC